MITPIQLPSVESVAEALRTKAYIADHSLATAVFLALKLNRPLFLEGEAGVGKTEVAKILSQMLDTRLIRLQCYEGLDVSTAVYEWNYARQMLQIRLMEATGSGSQTPEGSAAPKDKGLRESAIQDLFSDTFLLRRPLLQAIDSRGQQNGKAPILLIDELDRADEEFEAFLLEVLSDFQITIPEIGTISSGGAAGGRHYVQPHARDSRRAETTLPLPLDRLPQLRERVYDPEGQGAGRFGEAVTRGRGLCAGVAARGTVQVPWRC